MFWRTQLHEQVVEKKKEQTGLSVPFRANKGGAEGGAHLLFEM